MDIAKRNQSAAVITQPFERKTGYIFIKRVFDVVLSLVALVLLSPVMLITAICIHCSDGGPAIFRQTRLTKDGREFTMYKFRSMRVDAEALLEQYLARNELNGPAFKIRQDPRVTKVGRFIRRTSIDELPQFYNVLRGDMSIIGPRPPLPREVAQYTSNQKHRLDVKCGIACLHEVSGRSDEKDFNVWVEQDLEYIRCRSLKLDLWIMLALVRTVITHKGAM